MWDESPPNHSRIVFCFLVLVPFEWAKMSWKDASMCHLLMHAFLFSRFGDGYTVTLRVAGDNPDLEAVSQFIKSLFPEAVLKVFIIFTYYIF